MAARTRLSQEAQPADPSASLQTATKQYVDNKLPLGEMSYTVTSTTQSLAASTDTLISFQQANITTVGLSVNSGTDKNTWTVLSGYSGWWEIVTSIRFDFNSADKFAMIGTPAKVYWDKNSNSGNSYNLNVATVQKLAVGDSFCAFAYTSVAQRVVREGTTLVSGIKAVQLRT